MGVNINFDLNSQAHKIYLRTNINFDLKSQADRIYCADSIHPHSTKHFIIKNFGQFRVTIAAMIKALTILTTLSNIVFAKLSDSCEVTAFHILFFLLKFQAHQFQCNNGMCISLEKR